MTRIFRLRDTTGNVRKHLGDERHSQPAAVVGASFVSIQNLLHRPISDVRGRQLKTSASFSSRIWSLGYNRNRFPEG
jgi:hypothetical protein